MSSLMSDLAREMVASRVLIRDARQQQTEASWEAVLAFPSFWSLRHDDLQSIIHCDETELSKCVLEDLLFVDNEQRRGSAAFYPPSQALRHLPQRIRYEQSARLEKALSSLRETGWIVADPKGDLSIAPGRLAQAMDFSGVYFGDEGEDDSDVFDGMMEAGGEALVLDVLEDLAADLASSPKV